MSESVAHNGVTFKVIPLESCLGRAQAFQDANKHWHSHVLSPRCDHNPYPGRYAIVLEDDTDGQAYIAPSDGFPEVDKQLVKILHGDDILDASKAEGGVAIARSAFLTRLFALDARGVAWHHHMHFPACVLNPHRGQWAITVESTEGHFSEAYAEEPLDVLREVEVLYFGNLDKAKG